MVIVETKKLKKDGKKAKEPETFEIHGEDEDEQKRNST